MHATESESRTAPESGFPRDHQGHSALVSRGFPDEHVVVRHPILPGGERLRALVMTKAKDLPGFFRMSVRHEEMRGPQIGVYHVGVKVSVG